MKDIQKQWFKNIPWARVLETNHSLCHTQKTAHDLRAESGEAARDLWEKAADRKMTLPEAVDVCRECCQLSPFVFNNGNTFASLAKTLVEDWVSVMPSVEAQILRTTIGHYVADHLVTRKELLNVIRHFASKWKINGVEHPLPAAAAPGLEPQISVHARPSQA